MPYKFIVVNKDSLTPLVWEFPWTTKVGDIKITTKSNETIILKDPFTLGEEVDFYLRTNRTVPIGIVTNNSNDLVEAINNM